jgi:hypothetical protein
MLTFTKTDDGYLITETMYGWADSTKNTILSSTTVWYSEDLMKRKINNDPIQDTHEKERMWFKEHYLKHFK